MSRRVGVASDDELTLALVRDTAKLFEAQVVTIPVLTNHDWESDWLACDAVIYDEHQLGGDTVAVLDRVEWSFMIESSEVANSKSNGLEGRIERFLGEALQD